MSLRLRVEAAVDWGSYQRESCRREASGRHILGATGRDRLFLTDLRYTPPPGFAAATARLTGFHQWLTVSAHRAEVKALGAGADRTSSFWLSAVVALREQVIAAQRQQWIWLLGLDDSQRVQLLPDGWVYVEEVPSGLNRLIDLVQKEMSLHFRSSAFDLLFNEDFDWEDAPDQILGPFLAPLKQATPAHARGQPLAVVGLGPRLGGLAASIARQVGMEPWSAPPPASPAETTLAAALSFETWLLRESARREIEDRKLTAAFDGAPLLLPAPEGGSGPGEDSAAPFDHPREIDGLTRPETEAASPPIGLDPGAGTANSGRGNGRSDGRRRRARPARWLRHHARQTQPARANESDLRKVMFVVIWVLAAAFAGHLLVEQSTENERARQEMGGR